MSDLAVLGIRFETSGDQQAANAMDRVRDKARDVGKAANDTQGSTKALGQSLRTELSQGAEQAAGGLGTLGASVARMGGVWLGAAAAVGALALAVRKGIQEWTAYEQVVLRANAVLEANQEAVGLSIEQLQDMAAEIEDTTLQTEEAVIQAGAVLASFGSVTAGNFQRVLGAAADLATVMGGDLSSAAAQLGKALEDPEQGLTALRRAGILFTDAEREMIAQMRAAGDEAGVLDLVLGKVESRMGSAAEGEASGVAGAAHRAGDAIGDFFRNTAVATGAADAFAAALEIVAKGFKAITPDLPTLADGIEFVQNQLADAERELEVAINTGAPAMAVDSLEAKVERLKNRLAELQAQAASSGGAPNSVGGPDERGGQSAATLRALQERRTAEAALNEELQHRIELANMASEAARIEAAGDAAVARAKGQLGVLLEGQEEQYRRLGEEAERAAIKREKSEAAEEQALRDKEKALRDAERAARDLADSEERLADVVRKHEEAMADAEGELSDFIDSLERQIDFMQLSESEQKVQLALMEAQGKLYDENGRKIRDLTDAERERIRVAVEGADEVGTKLEQEADQAEQFKEDLRDAAGEIGDAFEDATIGGGKLSGVLHQLDKDLQRLLFRMATRPLETAFNTFLDSFVDGLFAGSSAPTEPGGPGTPWLSARGSVVSAAARGTVVRSPTMLSSDMLIAEAGEEEGILPLARVNGKLGVRATGDGGGGTQVRFELYDQRGSGERVRTEQTTDQNGTTIIRAWIKDEVNRQVNEGGFDRALQKNFGIGRQPTQRM